MGKPLLKGVVITAVGLVMLYLTALLHWEGPLDLNAVWASLSAARKAQALVGVGVTMWGVAWVLHALTGGGKKAKGGTP